MSNITDIEKARDQRQQDKINTIWDRALASGNGYSPSIEDSFFLLVLRDAVDRKCRERGLIADRFDGEVSSFSLTTRFPRDFLYEYIPTIAEKIASEIVKEIGYIYSIVCQGPKDLAGNIVEERAMLIRVKL